MSNFATDDIRHTHGRVGRIVEQVERNETAEQAEARRDRESVWELPGPGPGYAEQVQAELDELIANE